MEETEIYHDEQQRRLLQEYIFNLEDIQAQAEELSVVHERLQQSQDMLMAVVGSTTHGICLLKNDSFIWCNEAFLDILGWDREEVIGQSIGIINPNFIADAKAGILSGTSSNIMHEYDLIHKNGHPVSCLITGRLLKTNDPSAYVLSITDFTRRKKMERELRQHRDRLEEMVKERTAKLVIANEQLQKEINERKWAEQALRESEEKYRTILYSIKEAYFELDMAGNIIFFNDVVYWSLKYPPEELMGMNYSRYCTAETAAKISGIYREIFQTKQPAKTYDLEFIRKDGPTINVEASVTMMLDQAGLPAGLRFVTRDVTIRKKAQEEREKLIRELKEALANVKMLSGLLPICSSCKKIRDDQGYWKQLESYISEHTDALFTHSYCPECADKLTHDVENYLNKDKK